MSITKLQELGDTILSQVCSFCDPWTLTLLLEASYNVFHRPIRWGVCTSPSLHFSFFQEPRSDVAKQIMDRQRVNFQSAERRDCRERIDSDGQQTHQEEFFETYEPSTRPEQDMLDGSITRILHLGNFSWKYLEFSNLRHATGRGWLKELKRNKMNSLVTLDFSGCSQLDLQLLFNWMEPTPLLPSLRHLNLQGCHRINEHVMDRIAVTLVGLHSLLLGESSQRIGDRSVNLILENLRQLRHLDLSGLKHITDQNGRFHQGLPESLVSLKLSTCEKLRFIGLEYATWSVPLRRRLLGRVGQQFGFNDGHELPTLHHHHQQQVFPDLDQPPRPLLKNLIKLDFESIGTPRRGLVEGALAYYAAGAYLREINISGCEQVGDWEINVLAVACAQSLTCLRMRACTIKNSSIQALARNCRNLAELDASGCFQVDDDGIMALGSNSEHRLQRTLKVLRIAALPELTDQAIQSLTGLRSLHLLDLNGCKRVSCQALADTTFALPHLIEVDGRDISNDGLGSILRDRLDENSTMENHLRFVNARIIRWERTGKRKAEGPPLMCPKQQRVHPCCTVRRHSQRLTKAQGVKLQAMMHCRDCNLVPAMELGICVTCASACHEGHDTYFGAMARFYCDCAYGINPNTTCRVLFRPKADQLVGED